jgi:hypothetical protein
LWTKLKEWEKIQCLKPRRINTEAICVDQQKANEHMKRFKIIRNRNIHGNNSRISVSRSLAKLTKLNSTGCGRGCGRCRTLCAVGHERKGTAHLQGHTTCVSPKFTGQSPNPKPQNVTVPFKEIIRKNQVIWVASNPIGLVSVEEIRSCVWWYQ